MKTFTKTTLWICVGCLIISTASYADYMEEKKEKVILTAEMIEAEQAAIAERIAIKEEASAAYHAARLAAKKEKLREELEAQGIDPDKVMVDPNADSSTIE